MTRGAVIFCAFAFALAGFAIGRLSAPSAPVPVEDHEPRKTPPAPGARALELARLKRLAVRVGSDDIVAGARKDVDAALRNRLAAAGFVIVPDTERYDALVQVRVEGFHFSAFEEHGAGSELHVVGLHEVEIDGKSRLIPHDLWQGDAMRLARKDRLDSEALALTEELLQHLIGAVDRAREAR